MAIEGVFALLVAAFVVTAVGATAYVYVQSDRDGRRSAERDARFAARTAAKQLGSAVATLQATVKGLAATPQVQATGFQQASGAVERPDLDGATRLYADAPVAGVGWTFSAGEDKATALAAGNRLRNRQLAIILAGLALVLAAACAVYRRVALPVSRLGAAVRSSTERTPPTPVSASGPAEVAALGDDVNGLIASVTHELAERERAERSALASERNYRLLFESSPLPMWIYDLETLAILEVNDAAIAQYGYSREAFLGATMKDIAPARPAAAPGAPDTARHRKRDGSEIKVRTISHRVSFDERPARFVLAEDVGEHKRLEGQLRQAQRMEAVGRRASGVAHDFNNLVMAVIGNSDLLLAQTPPDDPRRGEAEEIRNAGARAATLTKQLLAFGRGQALEPVVLDLNETVTALEPMLRRLIRSNVAIEMRLDPEIGRVRADRGQIEQVLVNLSVNAGDAMPGGGTLAIATTDTELDADYFRDHPASDGEPGRYTVLDVTDTGVGMDAETMSHIFEPFYTTKSMDHGTGLGFATVYGIVRQSGGLVWAYSEPGQGTSFKVYLPAAELAVKPRPPSSSPSRSPQPTCTPSSQPCSRCDGPQGRWSAGRPRAMTRSNAATTAGSNWVPAQRRSSASASVSDSIVP